jgi:RimJ/RimL family protein N-acetyltransferase
MDIFTMGLKTDRLHLVPLQEYFIDDIFSELTKEIVLYMSFALPKERRETETRVKRAITNMKNKDEIVLIGTDLAGKFIGSFGFHNIKTSTPKLGVWIKKSAHGKGLGREGLLSLIEWGQKNIDFEYILYPVDKDNTPSRKIAEIAGGVVEKDEKGSEVLHKIITPDGRILNEVIYRIYKKDV